MKILLRITSAIAAIATAAFFIFGLISTYVAIFGSDYAWVYSAFWSIAFAVVFGFIAVISSIAADDMRT